VLTTELLKCLPSELANPTTKPQVAVQLTTDATILNENYQLIPIVLGHRPVDLLRVATAPAAPLVIAMSFLIGILVAEAAAVGAPHMGLEGEPVAGAIAEAEATQTVTSPVSHAAATMPIAESRKSDATIP
jgi:xanthosine utilization system XapX-like protein